MTQAEMMPGQLPLGVEQILRQAARKLKDSASEISYQAAVQQVVSDITDRALTPDRGIVAGYKDLLENQRVQDPKLAAERDRVFDWAARQYFKLLLMDLVERGGFQNHALCRPPTVEEYLAAK